MAKYTDNSDQPAPPLSSLPIFAEPTAEDGTDAAGKHSRQPETPAAWALAGNRSADETDQPREDHLNGYPDIEASADPKPAPDSQHRGTSDDVDWGLVRAFRQQAADQLAAALREREGLNEAARHELGRSIVLNLLSEHADEALSTGVETFNADEQKQMAAAIFDALFGLGRLQPLVDDPAVENIEISGFDDVLLEYSDGRLEKGPPVADSDEELIDSLAFLASRSQSNERPFSPSNPELHLRLDGGSRLAAWAWITPRPAAVIRRHRLKVVTLDDLVELNMMSAGVASFLAAAVRAKKSIVVSGPQSAGKTTVLRALCAQLDPWERIGTIETEHELHLHELKDQHKRVIAWEARPGSGERGPDGRAAGEITVAGITYGSWRGNLSRLIVGEVRGHEVLSMFEAMQGGAGSMSTTHAYSGRAAVERLVTLATKTGAPTDFAYRQVAEHIDLIVQIGLETAADDGLPHRDRYISEIVAIEPGEHGRPAITDVYKPGPDNRAVPGALTHPLTGLARFGFDMSSFTGVVEAADPGRWRRQ